MSRDLKKPEQASQALDRILNSARLDPNIALQLAQQYAAMVNYPKLEETLRKLTTLAPNAPEAWYDLAALEATLGKSAQALKDLRQACDLSNQRLKQDPKARDLVAEAKDDGRFATLRQTPEFKQIVGAK